MDFNQFVDEVKGRIKQFLPIEYEGAQVKIEEIKKLNENYLGITVLKENQVIAPTFNLNQLYEMFQSDPQNSMENILRNITELVLDAPEQFDPKSITEYETAKDKLFIRVSSAEKNEEMLQNVPHQMREDLAITYHLAISIDDIGVGSTMITNDILKRYGISEEQLHADAMEKDVLEQTSCISFYAAECSEFPVLGEVHHDLTLPEALEAYEKIPAERMNGIKSVGFNLQEGSDYDGMMDLMVAGRSQREILDSIPFYKENKLVQEALKRVEQYIEEKSLNVEKTRPKEEKGEIQKTKSQKRREDMSL